MLSEMSLARKQFFPHPTVRRTAWLSLRLLPFRLVMLPPSWPETPRGPQRYRLALAVPQVV